MQNGEIYNYRELRRELERAGHRFRTHGDTEVLVHLYEEHGAASRSGCAACSRSRSGTRAGAGSCSRATASGSSRSTTAPTTGGLSFASELRALPRGEIDLDALEAFLAFNAIPAPLTIFREVRKLPAGHLLVWTDGEIELERFARPAPERRDPNATMRRSSWRSCAPACATRCAHTSSATFRSACCCPAASIPRSSPRSRRRRPRSSCTRSRSASRSASFDELAGARSVAERYGTKHHELVLRPDAALLLPALADAFDEPFADSSALPTYLVSQLAARDVKVALSGEGGDELFGGYYTYAADLLAAAGGRLARLALRSSSGCRASTAKASFDYRAKRFVRAAHLPPLERHHGWKEIFSPTLRAELTGRATRSIRSTPACALRRDGGRDELSRLQDVDLGVYLVDDLLVKTDRASMAHSLEARVPYLDTVVTNLALALPTRHKIRGLSKKVLLRKAAAPLLPREIVHGKKRGFSIPAAAWLRGELEPFARETLSPPTSAPPGVLRPEW